MQKKTAITQVKTENVKVCGSPTKMRYYYDNYIRLPNKNLTITSKNPQLGGKYYE